MVEHGTTCLTSNLATFIHTPLGDAGKQIRLLQFRHSYDHHAIDLAISTWPFGNAPPYVAASYTWGSPEDTCEITINEQVYAVRRNCRNALLQIAARAPLEYVWADSICINQNDLDEKAQQVGIMGEIFAKAEVVYSCVGDHADGSENALYVGKDLVFCFKNDDRDDQEGALQQARQSLDRTDHEVLGRLLRLKRHMDDRSNSRPAGQVFGDDFRKALTTFSYRPYWHRMWVIQEVYLARQCLVLCGQDCLPFDDLASVLGYCVHAIKVANDHSGHNRRISPARLHFSYLWRLIGHRVGVKGPARTGQYRMSFEEAMQNFLGWECNDLRDRLYALRSIVSWPMEREPLKPDYRISTVRVALYALQQFRITPVKSALTEPMLAALLSALEVTAKNDEVQQMLRQRSQGTPETSGKAAQPLFVSGGLAIQALQLGSLTGKENRIVTGENQMQTIQVAESIYADSIEHGLSISAEDGKTLCLCSRTLPGDVLLEMSYTTHLYWVIFRDVTGHGTYDLVGPALPRQMTAVSPAKGYCTVQRLADKFTVRLECEDFLVLYLFSMAHEKGRLSLEEQEQFLSFPRAKSGSISVATRETKSKNNSKRRSRPARDNDESTKTTTLDQRKARPL